jgi:hypothetical protein
MKDRMILMFVLSILHIPLILITVLILRDPLMPSVIALFPGTIALILCIPQWLEFRGRMIWF